MESPGYRRGSENKLTEERPFEVNFEESVKSPHRDDAFQSANSTACGGTIGLLTASSIFTPLSKE